MQREAPHKWFDRVHKRILCLQDSPRTQKFDHEEWGQPFPTTLKFPSDKPESSWIYKTQDPSPGFKDLVLGQGVPSDGYISKNGPVARISPFERKRRGVVSTRGGLNRGRGRGRKHEGFARRQGNALEVPASGSGAPAAGSTVVASGWDVPASGWDVPASGWDVPASGWDIPSTDSKVLARGRGELAPASGRDLSATSTDDVSVANSPSKPALSNTILEVSQDIEMRVDGSVALARKNKGKRKVSPSMDRVIDTGSWGSLPGPDDEHRTSSEPINGDLPSQMAPIDRTDSDPVQVAGSFTSLCVSIQLSLQSSLHSCFQ